jgi:hypothetical protein
MILLFGLFCLTTLASAIQMVAALLTIRRCFVEKGLADQVSPLKMVVHALSFLIYIVTYFVMTLVVDPFLKKKWIVDHPGLPDYYFGWFIDTLFGGFAFTCLFFVMLHLGKKTVRSKSVTTSSTLL